MAVDLNGPGAAELDLDYVRIDAALALRVPESLALRRRVLPFGADDDGVHTACLDPDDHGTLEAVERALGRRVLPVRASAASLERALGRVFVRHEEARGDDAVRLVDDLLHSAILEQASDLHVEPGRDEVRIRYRIDGHLETHRTLPLDQLPALQNRIKVLAGMDIGEKRLPQDGRFSHRAGARGAQAVDVRVACMPTRFGERLTLRLLMVRSEGLQLPHLGLGANDLDTFRGAMRAPHGMVLLTGPTGSGKTTTLYAGLRELPLAEVNVLTIEDPIEYELDGISQIEVDAADRITFPRALRSVLRHDPDVLMIGEIRDLETAEVAVRAALTGHLVLSTLHTNSAASAVTRLVDMGVPAYLVGATMRLTVAQRLVRRLCQRCRRPRPLTGTEAIGLGQPELAGAVVSDPGGCAYCKGSGFAGRVGVFELFAPAPAEAGVWTPGADRAALNASLAAGRATMLRDDARRKVLEGATSPREALLVVEAN